MSKLSKAETEMFLRERNRLRFKIISGDITDSERMSLARCNEMLKEHDAKATNVKGSKRASRKDR